MEKRRADLAAMVSRGHPRSLRTQYYSTWMKGWSPSDRECALSQAFMKILESFDNVIKETGKDIVVGEKEAGKLGENPFGEDGMGVYKKVQEKRGILHAEGYELVSIVLEDLICEKCYQDGAVYCATVESVADKREDEQRWLPEERLKRMHALRPTILMGSQAVEHPLKEFIIARMSENLRKQVLVGVCLQVCMSAAGLVQVQFQATNELRNLRRRTRGLPELAPGEESEDDEIMCKNDYEEYLQRQLTGAAESLRLMNGEKTEAAEVAMAMGEAVGNYTPALLSGPDRPGELKGPDKMDAILDKSKGTVV